MNKTILRSAAALALFAITLATLSPLDWRPQTIFHADVDRFLAFVLVTLASVVAFPRRWPVIAAAIIAFAGVLELLQALEPTRHARLDDALVKMAGAVIGALLGRGVTEARLLRARYRLLRRRRAIAALERTHDFEDLAVTPGAPIVGIHFSQGDGLLHLRFANGEEAVFNGVSPVEALALAAAPSPADYYADNIRNRHSRAA